MSDIRKNSDCFCRDEGEPQAAGAGYDCCGGEGRDIYADDDFCCDSPEIHPDRIRAAEESLPSENELRDVAELYKLFADFSRIRILYLLAEKELCVCDLTELMDINQSAVSNHLRLLRNGKLIKSRREGKNVYYSPADSHVGVILRNGLEHIREDKGDMR